MLDASLVKYVTNSNIIYLKLPNHAIVVVLNQCKKIMVNLLFKNTLHCVTCPPLGQMYTDTFFMQAALKEAEKAAKLGEIPVGAVIVAENKIIARAHNEVERLRDPTAHAELLAITAAANYFSTKYLSNATLYVTLEPCIMCSGALYWSQINRLVFAANDPKRGYQTCPTLTLHPRTKVQKNILAKESNELLIYFFKKLRNTIL